jgi:hypothetical protein
MGSSCQIVWKIRQEVTDKQLIGIRGIGTVTGFPMDLGFQNKVSFSGLQSVFSRIRIGFFGLSVSFGYRIGIGHLLKG